MLTKCFFHYIISNYYNLSMASKLAMCLLVVENKHCWFTAFAES